MGTKKNKTIFEKILSIFAWFVFFIALFTAILSIFATFSGEKNGKEMFGYKVLIVNTDSMSKSPTSSANNDESIFFNAGDIIIIKTTKDGTGYKVGDVISFISYNPESFGLTLTHKIKAVHYSQSGKLIGYTTYGINTGVSDSTVVSPEMIIGSYVTKVPNLGNIFAYLKTPAGYYLSILTPSVLLIIYFSVNVGKYFGRREALKELANSQAVSYTSQEFADLCARVVILENKLKALNALNVDTQTLEQDKEELQQELVEIANIEENIEEEQKGLDINAKKVSFSEKLLGLEQQVQEYFNTVHNEIVSYKKVTERVSYKHISYRRGRKLLAKMTVRGKTLKLHLALDTNAFDKNIFFQKDLSNIKAYEEVPFTVKLKSDRGEKNAVKLITALMEENGLTKQEGYVAVDAVSLLNKQFAQTEGLGSDLATESVEEGKEGLVIDANKVSFTEKLLRLDKNVQEFFNTIHNELVSYKKVNGRVSFKGVSYRMGRKLLAKMTIRGKTLKLHLALDVNAFNPNVFFQKDMSGVKAYEQVPFTVKVKSSRAEKNAVKLVDALMEENNAVKKTDYVAIDAIKQLSNEYNQTAENTTGAELEEVAVTENKGLVINANKISFTEKLLRLDKNVQEFFNTIHNELVSYKKVNGRVSFKGVSYRMGRKLLAKMTIRGKTLKLHLALDVNAFNPKVFFQKDMSGVKAYEQVPFTVKVKSARAEKNAVKLVEALMEENGAVKKKDFVMVDALALLGKESIEPQIETNEIANETPNKLVINGKKISFEQRMSGLDQTTQDYFNVINSQLLSYKKVKGRVSFKGVSYRMGRKLLAKITVRGKTLTLYLALDVNAFNKNVFFQKDMSTKKAYSEVPFAVKVKSQRGKKNAIKLVDALMEQNSAVKKLVP